MRRIAVTASPAIIKGRVFFREENRMTELKRKRKSAFTNHPLYITFMYSLKAFFHPVIDAVTIQTKCLRSRAARKEPDIMAVSSAVPDA